MDTYRIRAILPSGVEVMKMTFPALADMDAYYSRLMTEEGLAVFAEMGSVIIMKEELTQHGWMSTQTTPLLGRKS